MTQLPLLIWKQNQNSKELGRLTEKKTTFIIAHRISSVREANLILMMEKAVVESGTHSELVEQKANILTYIKTIRSDKGR